MSISARLIALAVIGLSICWMLAAGSLIYISDGTLARANETARLYGVARLRDLVEDYSETGLDLEQMTAVQSVIEKAKELDTGIFSIDVADHEGRILYSTDPTGIGLELPLIWQSKSQDLLANSHASHFRIEERDEVIVGASVQDSIGKLLATVVVSSGRDLDAIRSLRLQIIGSALAIGIAAVLVGGLAAQLIARAAKRGIAASTGVMRGTIPGEQAQLFAPVAAQAVAAWDQANSELDSAFRELERLDEAV